MATRFQTLTFDEQSEILESLDKARKTLAKENANLEAHSLIDQINRLFHNIQTANTQEL